MRITCVGGGPAGLYFAVLARLAGPGHEVTVLEREPPGFPYGWGVSFGDEMLDDLFRHDPASARRIRDAAWRWDEYEVRAAGKAVTHLPGYGFGVARQRLLEILAERAVELGADLRHRVTVTEPPVADLVVAADGAGSRLRERSAGHFGTEVAAGRNRYRRLGTPHVFRSFTYGFERTAAGWIWFHAYPFSARASTVVVECTPETWTGLGLDRRDGRDLLADIFAGHLHGAPLLDRAGTGWQTFARVTNRRWDDGNVALLGDAAHTTHFTAGSGTTLALRDAIALADCITDGTALPAALECYEHRRRLALAPAQRAAAASSEWFEQLPAHAALPAKRFSYALSTRHSAAPAWRYALHAATQAPASRAALRGALSLRRWSRARRRAAAGSRATTATRRTLLPGDSRNSGLQLHHP